MIEREELFARFGPFEDSNARVSQLHVHPIKGAQPATTANSAYPIDNLFLTPAAPQYQGVGDRDLVLASVVDEGERQARFISRRGWNQHDQIRYPGDGVLARIRTRILDPGFVVADLPNMTNSLKLDIDEITERDAPTWDVGIHSGTLHCYAVSQDISEPFAELLNGATPDSDRSPKRDIRLFVRDRSQQRLMRPEYRMDGISHQVGGADGASILVGNRSSLDALDGDESQRNALRVGANIWLDGLNAFDEDRIAALQIGDEAIIVALNACGRCVATGVNPETGKQEHSFLPMLKSRRGTSIVTGDTNVYFATNFAPVDSESAPRIRVDDPVKIAWTENTMVAFR